jgi:2-polyprenyl-3-methyl-5-hydroxy-6-metoxy-1,4-benzoquinol methylase
LKETTRQDHLVQEAEAFDRQIQVRIAAGHIPDLRRARECAYFYNNTWRHPDYVRLDFGEQFELIRNAICDYAQIESYVPRVLEIGCGPGYISLELARNNYDVTGIDLSSVCIDIAKRYAQEDPWLETRGALHYLSGDFYNEELLPARSFDVVVFVGALHHFPDQENVGRRVRSLLKANGIIIVHEPTRDRMTRGNAAFIHLVRVLLSQGNGYFQQIAIPENLERQSAEIDLIYSEMRYESETGENVQSVNDNEAGFLEMNDMLQKNFRQLHFQERYAFFHEMIGGLRFEQHVNTGLARYLRDADAELCRLGVLQPTEFFYVGRNKDDM